MRLAVGQAPPRDSVEGNVMAAVDLARQAANAGSHTLLLSELFLSGYAPDMVADDPRRWAIHNEDDRLDLLRSTCVESGINVFVGAGHQDDQGQLTNAVLLLDQYGDVDRVYAKVHLWQTERQGFTAGKELRVLRIGEIRIGIGVCYDAGFPEFCRAYATHPVDLILFASAFARGEEERRYDVYHQARALESGVFVAVANAVGKFAGADFFGRSQIFGPRGERLIELNGEPGIGIYDIEPHAAASQRLPYLIDLHTPLTVVEKGSPDGTHL